MSTAAEYTGVSRVVSVSIVISPRSKQLRNRVWCPAGATVLLGGEKNCERWLSAS